MSKSSAPHSASPQANQLCPYLAVKGAQVAIDFYVKAFGASLDFKLIDPSDGRIGHAELHFGATRLADQVASGCSRR
jgi:uncharacterized glyoxalase superfamily protein PhnB